MRVFVTGASGHIGSALVPELLGAGHQVVGLARSDASAAALVAAGAQVRCGDLDDLDGLRAEAAASDGVIHLAYKHELAFGGAPDGYLTAAAHDLRFVELVGEVFAGTGKPFVATSGTAFLGALGLGRAGTEDDALGTGPRIDSENAMVALAARGVRTAMVRLAPTVHSDLDTTGFVPTLVGMARTNGFAAYVGDGSNRWPAIHTRDAARVYRLALESAPAGSRLHGTAEEGVPFRAIAEAIGRGLGLPATSIAPEEAAAKLGYLGRFAQIDNPTSSAKTQAVLGWTPTHAALIPDIDAGHYFVTKAGAR